MFVLINVKMPTIVPTIVGILTFLSRKIAFKAYLSLKMLNCSIFFILMSI